MPRRLITQPPLLPEAGGESQQVLRVRVWTHVTQNVHGARQPSVFLPLGMGRLGLGKRLCVFAVVCVVEPTSFSQIFPKAPAPDGDEPLIEEAEEQRAQGGERELPRRISQDWRAHGRLN